MPIREFLSEWRNVMEAQNLSDTEQKLQFKSILDVFTKGSNIFHIHFIFFALWKNTEFP
jgi:hypothetical protein